MPEAVAVCPGDGVEITVSHLEMHTRCKYLTSAILPLCAVAGAVATAFGDSVEFRWVWFP